MYKNVYKMNDPKSFDSKFLLQKNQKKQFGAFSLLRMLQYATKH